MEEEQWIDVGQVADWWGKGKNQFTCHQRAGAKENRIDGVLANCKAISAIHDFEVTSNPLIPTHKVLRLTLSRSAFEEERNYMRTIPSLKNLLTKTSSK